MKHVVVQSQIKARGLGVRPGTPDYHEVMLNHKQQIKRYYGTTRNESYTNNLHDSSLVVESTY